MSFLRGHLQPSGLTAAFGGMIALVDGTFVIAWDNDEVIGVNVARPVFAEIGKRTESFVRFSTVAGERGAADAERDLALGYVTRGR